MNTFMNKYTSKIYNTFMTRKPIETLSRCRSRLWSRCRSRLWSRCWSRSLLALRRLALVCRGVAGGRFCVRPRWSSVVANFSAFICSRRSSISDCAEKVSSLVGVDFRKAMYSCAFAAMSSLVKLVISLFVDMRIVARHSSGMESKSLCLIWVSP